MKKFAYKFWFGKDTRTFYLTRHIDGKQTGIKTWPKSGYSREKALKSADRTIGEDIRREQGPVEVTYDHDTSDVIIGGGPDGGK